MLCEQWKIIFNCDINKSSNSYFVKIYFIIIKKKYIRYFDGD